MRLSRLLAAVTLLASCSPPLAFAETAHVSLTLRADSVTPKDSVPTIKAMPMYSAAIASEIRSVDTPLLNKLAPLMVLPFLFAGSVKTIVADMDGGPALVTSDRRQLNNIIADFYYWTMNRIISATAATYPACATATVTSKVKTTNATVLLSNGVVVALAATDNYWTLTGGVLATGLNRKYLLCSNAAGVASVIASDDQAVLANCSFAIRPADGVVICGVLSITNASGADFTPAVTLLGAAGITAAYVDATDVPFFSKKVLPAT